MNLLKGIEYNFKGFLMGIKNPTLLFLGILRFVVVIFLAILLSGAVFYFHNQILNLIWEMPESGFFIYLWKIVSWIIAIFLASIAALIAYFIAQFLFCVFIMDYMSRKVENIITGKEIYPDNTSYLTLFFYLIKQEIPRALLPMILSFIIMFIGFLTPLGSLIAIISSIVAVTFLAWDNTDLVPARRMLPFNKRLKYLRKNIMFHIGFGLLFLIPVLNILFLSFAPVGATLYYIENIDSKIIK
ncbi:MAG: EI24 domain-containing protein [Desulfobacteraceae bacterium]|nr:EI24 domain-containing protein [Desulfobacteraceae bacterium]